MTVLDDLVSITGIVGAWADPDFSIYESCLSLSLIPIAGYVYKRVLRFLRVLSIFQHDGYLVEQSLQSDVPMAVSLLW